MTHRPLTLVTSAASALVLATAGVLLLGHGAPSRAEPAPPTQEISIKTHDPIAVLEARIEAGETTLAADDEHGYLAALLAALDIPVSSQGLVFSRTSLQTDRISPWAPRALYFNDDVYIGWVQNSPFVEIAAIDPDEGAVFYTLPQDGAGRPVFQRQTTTCLMCHESRSVTGGVPGVIVRSVLTDRMGYVIGELQEGSVTDRTPVNERFGGYYVTGTNGDEGHAGNTLSPLMSHEVTSVEAYLADFDLTANANVTELAGRFDPTPYLIADSDIVALLVLGHQGRAKRRKWRCATRPPDCAAAAMRRLNRACCRRHNTASTPR